MRQPFPTFPNVGIIPCMNITMDNSPRLLLASQSPRRRALLAWLDLPFSVTAADVDETPAPHEPPAQLAVRLAHRKALAVAPVDPQTWILSADTVVALNGQTLGKPRDADEAWAMLTQLRDRPHWVHTGIVLHNPAQRRTLSRRATTRVWMRTYTDVEIQAYIDTQDPLDKAGAYAIQHPGFHPVERLERCYANVVGLPLCAVVALLAEAGRPVTLDLPQLCLNHFAYRCPAIDGGTIA